MTKSWQVGDQIQGRWEVYRILEGGAGIVYVVYDHAFREPFAAKTFRDEVFAHSPLIGERFIREALAWTRLDVHPNIAHARMLEKVEGKPFLFLEYVSGGDLGSWIGTPALMEDLPQLLRFAIQFCDGMIYAVSRGIRAHRDIKPRNCLITHDGVLKVTDFGLAKLFDDEKLVDIPAMIAKQQTPNLTVSAIGTCTHMAPEQFESGSRVDARMDIYSFGVMLYQMVSGELPFSGETWETLEHMHKTQVSPYLANTDKRLADIVQTCMAKKPADRFSNFGELRERLARIYEGVTGTACPEPAQGEALTAAEWNNKGSSLDNLGRHAESITCYDTALKLDPTLASAWFNKAVAQFGSGKVQDALSCYDKALSIANPRPEQAWSNKGVVLKGLGKVQEAIRCYDQALSKNPRYANAWINKGVALRALGKPDKALDCYQQAVRLNPKDENAWTNMGNVLYELKQPHEAIVCYDRALGVNPALDLTWLNKGMALGVVARHPEAMDCYGKALEINPQLEQAWFMRGMTLLKVFQSHREAVPYLEQAERLGSKAAKRELAACLAAVNAK